MNTSRTDLSNSIKFSNAAGGGYVTQDEINASNDLLKNLLANHSANVASANQTGCKKPFLNMGKKKKAYEKCLSDSKAEAQKAKDDDAKRQQEILDIQKQALNRPASEPKPKTFLYMPMEVGIPVVIIGASALLFGGWKAIKYFKNKK